MSRIIGRFGFCGYRSKHALGVALDTKVGNCGFVRLNRMHRTRSGQLPAETREKALQIELIMSLYPCFLGFPGVATYLNGFVDSAIPRLPTIQAICNSILVS